MGKLFNKYHSRGFLFSLEVLSKLIHTQLLCKSETEYIAQKYGLDYADQVLQPLTENGIIVNTKNGYMLDENFRVPDLPPDALEHEYLQHILHLPEAELLLDEEILTTLRNSEYSENIFSAIQKYEPLEKQHICIPENIRIIMRAIREKRDIKYKFVSRDNQNPRECIATPWKLEHSSFDGRWWVILYDSEERRTIKAVTDNLQEISLEGKTSVKPQYIEMALEEMIEKEPVVLRVNNTRGALERCFILFENQLFEGTKKVDNNTYETSFRYYRFDESDIIKKLLYLGPSVVLVGPAKLKRRLAESIELALKH